MLQLTLSGLLKQKHLAGSKERQQVDKLLIYKSTPFKYWPEEKALCYFRLKSVKMINTESAVS